MSKFIEKWYNKVRPYLFKYNKGFFVLPYLNNSPQLMWQSLQHMPFIKFSPTAHMSESKTPFLDAQMYYHELDANLVVFYNEIHYKNNVTYKHYRKSETPLTFYCLSGSLSESPDGKQKTIVNDIHYNGQLWILNKPESVIRDYHFKHSRMNTVNIYFTYDWLMNNLQLDSEDNESLLAFINSENQTFGRNYEKNDFGMSLLERAAQIMKHMPVEHREEELHQLIQDILIFFKSKVLPQIQIQDLILLPHVDMNNVLKAEKLLTKNLFAPFPGIQQIAKKIGISETKLKSDFKLAYKLSMFQYFRQKQMDVARKTLEQNPATTIKKLSLMFGYENPSKFTTSFKKHHRILPSELNKA